MKQGVLLLKGAQLRKREARQLQKNYRQARQCWRGTGRISVDYILQEDTETPSLSFAASVLMGASKNGWDFWRTRDGRSVDEAWSVDGALTFYII